LISKVVSNRDMRAWDPVISKHREATLEGRWRPGMYIDPMVEGDGIGWSNPFGNLKSFLGLAPNEAARRRELAQKMLSSPHYQALRDSYATGKTNFKDFAERTRGTPVFEYDDALGNAAKSNAIGAFNNQFSRFADAVKDTDKLLDADRSAYSQARM
jgi:hypothetical protein